METTLPGASWAADGKRSATSPDADWSPLLPSRMNRGVPAVLNTATCPAPCAETSRSPLGRPAAFCHRTAPSPTLSGEAPKTMLPEAFVTPISGNVVWAPLAARSSRFVRMLSTT
jgi:hypothetical protein